MSETFGYVVIEFNQASGQPSIESDVHQDRDDAADLIRQYEVTNAIHGRRERYAIGTITIEDDA